MKAMNLYIASILILSLGKVVADGKATQAAPQTDTTDANRGKYGKYTYIAIERGNGFTDDGYPFSLNIFRGPNGEKIHVKITHYRTVERCTTEYERKVRDANKVIEKGETSDNQNRITGERAVLLITDRYRKEAPTVVTTAGSSLREIWGPTLQDVLDSEAWNNRSIRPKQ